jgi:hypothetical protein
MPLPFKLYAQTNILHYSTCKLYPIRTDFIVRTLSVNNIYSGKFYYSILCICFFLLLPSVRQFPIPERCQPISFHTPARKLTQPVVTRSFKRWVQTGLLPEHCCLRVCLFLLLPQNPFLVFYYHCHYCHHSAMRTADA